MGSICILTDNTAQFTRPAFTGSELVNVIPFQVIADDLIQIDNPAVRVTSLPSSARLGFAPHLNPPKVEDFKQIYLALSHSYNEIIAIFLSSQLSPLVTYAQQAAKMIQGRVSVQVIDSQSTSVGLGFLVQTAAEAAACHSNAVEIERVIRGFIPHIYSVFCIPGLTYLHNAGYIDYAQAIVGEMLNLLPIFTLEEGHLSPLEKARNLRSLTDYFQEFLDEFSDLHHIAFVQSAPPLNHESRTLREHAQTNFPGATFSEHALSFPLAALFGPRSLGVIVVELPDNNER
jgi:DegV family protein with EDD domain